MSATKLNVLNYLEQIENLPNESFEKIEDALDVIASSDEVKYFANLIQEINSDVVRILPQNIVEDFFLIANGVIKSEIKALNQHILKNVPPIQIPEGEDLLTFEYLGEGFYSLQSKVFIGDQLVTDEVNGIFTPVSSVYAIDDLHVYFKNREDRWEKRSRVELGIDFEEDIIKKQRKTFRDFLKRFF